MRVLHLFAGAGGSHLCGELLGWESVGSVEIEPYCQAVIKHHYPDEVIHGDICTYSATHLAGLVDGICGGFPCQDISSAGKGAGITGERSGLWKEFARIIKEAKPAWAFIENSPLLRSRGLEVVLQDLAEIGYNAEWATYRASDVGAPHRRDRMWILAYASQVFRDGCQVNGRKVSESRNGCVQAHLCDAEQMSRNGRDSEQWGCSALPGLSGQRDNVVSGSVEYNQRSDTPQIPDAVENTGLGHLHSEKWETLQRTNKWWVSEPGMGRVVDGVANRVHRLAALGNGWVPLQAAEAFRQLYARAIT
jgi:DNA (cytosine-5)-methyltransferase 1